MEIGAVLKIIGTVISIISGLVELYQKADEYFDNPDEANRSQYESQLVEIVRSRQVILDACASIYQAITQLSNTMFRQVIADKLGDADQAQQALDNWRRPPQSVGQRDIALNESAGALADLLQYWRNGVYPSVSLVVPLMEVLLVRLWILKQADPSFITSGVARQPIEESAGMLWSTANDLEARILAANQVKETVTHRMLVRIDPETGSKERIRITKVAVSYRNVTGTAAYHRSVSFELGEEAEADDAIAGLHAEASAARSGGLAEDLRQAQIENFRSAANKAERLLRGDEMRVMERIVGRKLSLVERAEFLTLRESSDLRGSIVGVADKYVLEDGPRGGQSDDMTTTSGEILSRSLTNDEMQVLTALARTFGSTAALRVLLYHPDSVVDKRAKTVLDVSATSMPEGRPGVEGEMPMGSARKI